MFPLVKNSALSALSASLCGLGILLSATACRFPVTKVDLGAIPGEAPAKDLVAAQTRSIPLPREQAFSRAMEVLLDMGFQIRGASLDAGQINMFKAWEDPSGSTLSLEATLLFRAEEAGGTRLRMAAAGNWKHISMGGVESASADVSGVVGTEDPEGYRKFLDRLVAGMGVSGKS